MSALLLTFSHLILKSMLALRTLAKTCGVTATNSTSTKNEPTGWTMHSSPRVLPLSNRTRKLGGFWLGQVTKSVQLHGCVVSCLAFKTHFLHFFLNHSHVCTGHAPMTTRSFVLLGSVSV